jgi:hypothetical protein
MTSKLNTRTIGGLGALVFAAALAAPAASGPQPPSAPMELEKAGWILITASEDTWVFMKAAEKAEGGVRRVWTAYDSETVRDRMGFSFRSVESLSEYNCQKRLTRVVEERFHAEPALHGEGWHQPNFIPTPWATPAPGSVGAVRMAFACKALSET